MPNTVETLRGMWDTLYAEATKVRSQIDVLSGEGTPGKSTLVNKLTSAESIVSTSNKVGGQVLDYLSHLDEPSLVGVYYNILDILKDNYQSRVDAAIQKMLDEGAVPTDELPTESMDALREKYSTIYKNLKGFREMASVFGEKVDDNDDWTMPTRLGGKKGARGTRPISNYTWKVNGEQLQGKDDTYMNMAKNVLGFDSPKTLTAFLRELGVYPTDGDVKDPLIFTIPAEKNPQGAQAGDVIVRGDLRQAEDTEEDDDEDESSEVAEV